MAPERVQSIKTFARENCIPFIIEGTNIPNAETIAAMKAHEHHRRRIPVFESTY